MLQTHHFGGGCKRSFQVYFAIFSLIVEAIASANLRGSLITLARDIPAFCSYFLTYELLRERFKKNDGSLGFWDTAVIGGLAGVAGWAVEIPLDALKNRHQGCLR